MSLPVCSVLICTNTAPPTLEKCLASIVTQDGRDGIEIVIVNNGFSEARQRELIEMLSREETNFQIVKEEQPGLGFARRTGFAVCRGEYIVMLDDDNTLSKDFFIVLKGILSRNIGVGGIGGLVKPVWEEQPKDWLVGLGISCLSYNCTPLYQQAVGEVFYEASESSKMRRPPGGGMIIHRSVARHYLQQVTDPRRISLSRSPGFLGGCEDDDLWAGISALKLPTFFSDRLVLFHHIAKYRTRLSYLSRLLYTTGYSYGVLDQYRNSSAYSLYWEARGLLRRSVNCLKALHGDEMTLPHVWLDMLGAIGRSIGRLSKPPSTRPRSCTRNQAAAVAPQELNM